MPENLCRDVTATSGSTTKPSQFEVLHIQDPRSAGAISGTSVYPMGSLSEQYREDVGQESSLTESGAKITHLGNDIDDLEAGRPGIHVVQEEAIYVGKEKEESQSSL